VGEPLKEEEKGYKIRFSRLHFYETAAGGLVFIYKAKNEDFTIPLGDFYVVSYDDGANELVWAADTTVFSAISLAEREWNRIYRRSPTKNDNPFSEVKKYIKSGI